MIQLTSNAASAPRIQARVEDYAPVASLHIASEGALDLTFHRYEDGGVLLRQSDDRVYLSKEQIELLVKFSEGMTR